MNELIKELIKETLLIETRKIVFHPSWNVKRDEARILDKNKEYDKLFLKRIKKISTDKPHGGRAIYNKGSPIAYVLPKQKDPIATREHENFHMMLHKIRNAHPEIKNIKEKICWYFLNQLSNEQVTLISALIGGEKFSYEEAIAYLLTYVNSEAKRKKSEYRLKKIANDNENEFDIQFKIFKAYKDLANIIKTTPAEIVINAIANRRAGGDDQ